MIDLDNEYEEDILQFHLSDFSLWVSEAIGILAELKFPGVTHETVITEEDAREAYYFALDHCRKRQKRCFTLATCCVFVRMEERLFVPICIAG
jgi:CRISPR-associated endonuclease/helicase Cas3